MTLGSNPQFFMGKNTCSIGWFLGRHWGCNKTRGAISQVMGLSLGDMTKLLLMAEIWRENHLGCKRNLQIMGWTTNLNWFFRIPDFRTISSSKPPPTLSTNKQFGDISRLQDRWCTTATRRLQTDRLPKPPRRGMGRYAWQRRALCRSGGLVRRVGTWLLLRIFFWFGDGVRHQHEC